MRIILFYIVSLLLITLILRLGLGAEWTGFILSIISILFAISHSELRKILDNAENKLINTNLSSTYSSFKKKAAGLFEYSDLTILIVTCFLVAASFTDAFHHSLTDMQEKGFIEFPRGNDGYVHLGAYMAGFVLTPIWLLSLSIYGFYKGFYQKRIGYLKTFLAVLSGLVTSILLRTILQGGFSGIQNYQDLAQANSDTLPVGATFAPVTTIIALVVLLLTFSAFIAWFSSILGAGLRHLYKKFTPTKELVNQ